MNTDIPTLSDTERTIQRAVTARRYGYGRNVRKDYLSTNMLRYMTERAFRGGPVYSLFAGFRALEQVEWAMKVLTNLTEDRIPVLKTRLNFGYDDGWDKAGPVIHKMVADKFAADLAEAQEGLEDSGSLESFRSWNTTAVVKDGKVVDPWGYDYKAAVDWFLANMTPFLVFTVYQTVREAVEECMEDNLGLWAEGDTDNDPRKVAADTFDRAMRNLSEHLDTVLKG